MLVIILVISFILGKLPFSRLTLCRLTLCRLILTRLILTRLILTRLILTRVIILTAILFIVVRLFAGKDQVLALLVVPSIPRQRLPKIFEIDITRTLY
jgi:hypothetical protein